MRLIHLTLLASLFSIAPACVEHDAAGPEGRVDEPAGDRIRDVLAEAGGTRIVGVAPQPRPETGHAPRYELSAEDMATGSGRSLGIEAIDAALDGETRTLAWIDPMGTLYAAPLASAPSGRRDLASDVLPGLAARSGRLAFAIRVNGPDTSPFAFDLRDELLLPLDDGPGPDEIIDFSPAGDAVLLLSGRTGLASLFEAGVTGTPAVQLTNEGLSPGPDLDPAEVTPAPMSLRDVVWDRNGVAYRAADAWIWIRPSGEVEMIDRDASTEEVVR